MGGSGVGKSTLLSILNGNIIPGEGNVCLNGHPLSDPECKQLIGFVPQDDLLIEELTVFQNLWYTARLCFANLTKKEIEDRVNTILEDLDLSKIRDLAVGSPIRKTISGGQRKRLNIALELIREPAILYLDEPTSGLSSTDSEKVIMLLKEQTHRGRLVVVNIHQPSSEIYKLFDRLWLLDTGGYPIYDGNPIEAITYFKRIANYTDQDISVCGTCGNINPELILTIIDAKKIDDSGNQTNIRKITSKEWHELYVASRPKFQEVKPTPLPPNHQQESPSPPTPSLRIKNPCGTTRSWRRRQRTPFPVSGRNSTSNGNMPRQQGRRVRPHRGRQAPPRPRLPQPRKPQRKADRPRPLPPGTGKGR